MLPCLSIAIPELCVPFHNFGNALGAPVEGEREDESDGSVGWAGEEYEEEQVRGVLPCYLKYSKRLQQRPEQCIRYALHEQFTGVHFTDNNGHEQCALHPGLTSKKEDTISALCR